MCENWRLRLAFLQELEKVTVEAVHHCINLVINDIESIVENDLTHQKLLKVKFHFLTMGLKDHKLSDEEYLSFRKKSFYFAVDLFLNILQTLPVSFWYDCDVLFKCRELGFYEVIKFKDFNGNIRRTSGLITSFSSDSLSALAIETGSKRPREHSPPREQVMKEKSLKRPRIGVSPPSPVYITDVWDEDEIPKFDHLDRQNDCLSLLCDSDLESGKMFSDSEVDSSEYTDCEYESDLE